jgi:hypothetical protein
VQHKWPEHIDLPAFDKVYEQASPGDRRLLAQYITRTLYTRRRAHRFDAAIDPACPSRGLQDDIFHRLHACDVDDSPLPVLPSRLAALPTIPIGSFLSITIPSTFVSMLMGLRFRSIVSSTRFLSPTPRSTRTAAVSCRLHLIAFRPVPLSPWWAAPH